MGSPGPAILEGYVFLLCFSVDAERLGRLFFLKVVCWHNFLQSAFLSAGTYYPVVDFLDFFVFAACYIT